MAEKQPDKQLKRNDPARADHLKGHRWKPGQSGNPGGRPKGAINLSKRIENKLLEALQGQGPEGKQVADALASAIVKAMVKDPVKAERLIARVMDRDEGPIAQNVELSTTFTATDMARYVESLDDGRAGGE